MAPEEGSARTDRTAGMHTRHAEHARSAAARRQLGAVARRLGRLCNRHERQRPLLRFAAGLATAAFLLLGGCVAASDESRLGRHASVDRWAHALAQQVGDPVRLVPQATLLVAAPLLFAYDRELSRRSIGHPQFTHGDTKRGDAAALALGAVATSLGAARWIDGDEGRSLEVLAESLAATMGATGLLKLAVPRGRPSGASDASFPSGHSALSFCTATFVARSTWDASDAWWHGVGYLAYAPAAYIGVSRIEGRQHFPTDVVFGAFLGVAMTQWVYDAHVGDRATGRDGIHEGSPAPRSGFAPRIGGDSIGLAWFVRF